MSPQAEIHYCERLCNDLTSPCASFAKRQLYNYCSTMRIAPPLASTSYLVQANVDSMQGQQELRQKDQAQIVGLARYCCRSAVVVLQQQGVLLQLEEVVVKEAPRQQVLQRAQ